MQKKTKVILFGIGSLIALVTIPFILIFAWLYFDDDPVLPSKYGIKIISVGEKQIYFKRKAIWFNYDYIILSPNNDICADYNSETDIRFLEFNPSIYYKINKDVLNLFTSTSTQPKNFPVKIKIQDVEESRKWSELKQKNLNGELELLDIPLSDAIKCN